MDEGGASGKTTSVVIDQREDGRSLPELRGKVLALEAEMLKMPQVEITPVHYFADGLYAREILIPKGTVLTGKIHLFEHLNIISKGDISVMTDEGIKRIVAPATIVSKPGIKRVGYAHEDTVWTTIHACTETEPEKAEALLVVSSYEEFQAALGAREEQPCRLFSRQ